MNTQRIISGLAAAAGALAFVSGSQAAMLGSFETGLDGWGVQAGHTAELSTIGATEGSQSLKITKTAGAVHWGITRNNAGDSAWNDAFAAALADPSSYAVEFDVTWRDADIPEGVWGAKLDMVIQNSAGGWLQIGDIAETNGSTDETIHVSIPLTAFTAEPVAVTWTNVFLALNTPSGGSVYLDNIQLVPEPASLALVSLGLVCLGRRRR